MGQHAASEDLGPIVRGAVRVVLIAAAYFLANRLGFLFPDSHRVISALWPAGGIG